MVFAVDKQLVNSTYDLIKTHLNIVAKHIMTTKKRACIVKNAKRIILP